MWERIIQILSLLVVIALVAAVFFSDALTALDPSATAVVIGVLAASVPNFIGHWYTGWREERRWQRQQEKREEQRLREEEKVQKEKIRSAYYNSLRVLSEIVSTNTDRADEIKPEKRMEQLREAHDWLTRLSLYHLDQYTSKVAKPSFVDRLKWFTEHPDTTSAEWLRNDVLELALNDTRLHSGASPRAANPQDRLVRVYVAEDYRQQQFWEKGIEVPYSRQITCKWTQLTPSQRQKIVDLYFKGTEGVPQILALKVPKFTKDGTLASDGGQWWARLNPETATIAEIFVAWEAAYDEALARAPGEVEAEEGSGFE